MLLRILIIDRFTAREDIPMPRAAFIRLRFCRTAQKGLAEIPNFRPDIVCLGDSICDCTLTDLVSHVEKNHPDLPFLLLVSGRNITDQFLFRQRHRTAILERPIVIRELLQLVYRVLFLSNVQTPFSGWSQTIPTNDPSVHEACTATYQSAIETLEEILIGRSPQMHRIRRKILTYASHRDAVIITGESGTGKEISAKLIHRLSQRKGPFNAVNMAALPGPLAESALFGHVKGAFTDAHRDHTGLFLSSEGGTLFLDEIGDLDPRLQPKLLRVLEEGTITPVGSTSPIRIDVRIISATNRDLPKEILAGRFRQDLYYRLNSLTLELPPLRERKEDILELTEAYLTSQNYSPEILTTASLNAILGHSWPGNVRELYSVLRKGAILSEDGFIHISDDLLASSYILNPESL